MENSSSTYFQRQLILPEIGEIGMQKLRNAKVLVVGAGGLGCAVLEQLSGAGVGTIGIIDNDVVQLSNLHRQSLYTEEEIGEFKVFCASRRLLKRNKHSIVKVYPQQFHVKNALQLVKDYDIVLDCTDNYSTRYLINDVCILLNKPFVYGAIYRFQGQVAVFNVSNGPTYRCYSPKFPTSESATDCVNSGVIGVIPSLIGNMQALETIKWILGESVLSEDLLLIDFKTMVFQKVQLPHRTTDYSYLSPKLDHPYYAIDCAMERELSPEKVFEMFEMDVFDRLVDVRELEEVIDKYKFVDNIPLSQLRKNEHNKWLTGNILFFCKSGMRSREAMQIAEEFGDGEFYSLKGEMTKELLDLWRKRK